MTSSTNCSSKYNARRCYYSIEHQKITSTNEFEDSQYFASRLEAEVYIELLKIPNVIIKRQEKICMKPSTPIYNETMWRCDFLVTQLGGNSQVNYCLVEAKGMVTREFKLMIQQLEFFNRYDWERLVIVSQNGGNEIDAHITTVGLHQLNEVVLSRLGK